VKVDKTKYMFMSRNQNAVKTKRFVTRVTNQKAEIKNRKNTGIFAAIKF